MLGHHCQSLLTVGLPTLPQGESYVYVGIRHNPSKNKESGVLIHQLFHALFKGLLLGYREGVNS